jgi:uncharacterized delta-60 repeat protein
MQMTSAVFQRYRAQAAIWLGVFFSAVVVALPAWASGDELDPSFGGDGRVVVQARPAGPWAGGPIQIATLPGGGVVIAGTNTLVRLQADGEPDPGFGPGGAVTMESVEGFDLRFEDVDVDSRGRVVVFGAATSETVLVTRAQMTPGYLHPSDAVVLRFLPDGRLDPGFGRDGVVRSDFGMPPTSEFAARFVRADLGAVDAHDRPVLALGTLEMTPNCVTKGFWEWHVRRLARLTVDGEPDPGFDSSAGAVALHNVNHTFDFALRKGGAPQVVATRENFCGPHLTLRRMQADGAPDIACGRDGRRSYALGDRVADIATDSAGRTLALSGIRWSRQANAATGRVLRINADGGIDRRFGNDDVGRVFIPGAGASLGLLVTDPRGRVYIIGTLTGKRVKRGRAQAETQGSIAVLRLTVRGNLDRGFGTNGMATAGVGPLAVADQATFSAGSGLLVAGSSDPTLTQGDPGSVLLARFLE